MSRQLQFSHMQSLLEHLREELEPAMILHLVVVILFQQHTNCMLHAPGKLVPHITSFLSGRVNTSYYSKLIQYQHLVMLQLKLASKSSAIPSTGVNSQASNSSVETNSSSLMQISQETKATESQIDASEPDTEQQTAREGSPSTSASYSAGEAVEKSGPQQESDDPECVAQKLRDLSDELKQLVIKPKKSDNE